MWKKPFRNLAPVICVLQYPIIDTWCGEMPDAAFQTGRPGSELPPRDLSQARHVVFYGEKHHIAELDVARIKEGIGSEEGRRLRVVPVCGGSARIARPITARVRQRIGI
jgi:hypothetical protein